MLNCARFFASKAGTWVNSALVALPLLVTAFVATVWAQAPAPRFADVNGTRIHYLAAGTGEPIILLHGYAQTSHMWRPLMAQLARTNTVIAPDLRGFGQSAKPNDGYDKRTMAQDIHAVAASLGYNRVRLAGHDIGLMVAYAYAAQYPAEVDRIVLMDAFLPGIGDWTKVWLLRNLSGISISTARHHFGWSPAESARILSISGTTSRPTAPSPSLSAIAGSMREPMRGPAQCGPDLKFSEISRGTRKISRTSPTPGSRCRCWCCRARRPAGSS